jgi:3-isopropylmalate/(R)-2-methylmalate dehydratase small subunit
VILPQEAIDGLWAAVEAIPALVITVSLDERTVSYDGTTIGFALDDYTRWRLMEGLDDISLTLKQIDAIDAFESRRSSLKPATLPVR